MHKYRKNLSRNRLGFMSGVVLKRIWNTNGPLVKWIRPSGDNVSACVPMQSGDNYLRA